MYHRYVVIFAKSLNPLKAGSDFEQLVSPSKHSCVTRELCFFQEPAKVCLHKAKGKTKRITKGDLACFADALKRDHKTATFGPPLPQSYQS